MASKNIEILLTEYEEKRRRKEIEFDKRREEIYAKIPRLAEIENEINKNSIDKTRAILNGSKNIEEFNQRNLKLLEEKEKIVKKENIELKIKYECNNCKDTGYVKDKNGRTVMCNCLKQKLINLSYNQSNLSDIEKDNFENFNENLFSDEGKKSARKNINTIKKASLKFIEEFDNKNTKNLLFTGNTGLGKTYMSNCIANELLKKGKNVLYQTAPVLLETIIDNKFNKYNNQNSDEFYNNILTVDLLINDDLGAECLNSMKVSELFTILNTRILNLNNKITKTIISTNLSIEQIFKIYEERIGSRIAGYYDIYQFFGDDLRLKK